MGSPTANLDYTTYQQWAEHPAVAWTIPYALGDSHQGFRVIGTNESFYERYRYRGGQAVEVLEGSPAAGVFDVTLGADVAAELGYAVGGRDLRHPRHERGGLPEPRRQAVHRNRHPRQDVHARGSIALRDVGGHRSDPHRLGTGRATGSR